MQSTFREQGKAEILLLQNLLFGENIDKASASGKPVCGKAFWAVGKCELDSAIESGVDPQEVK